MSTPHSDFAPRERLDGQLAVIAGGTGAIGLLLTPLQFLLN